MKSPAFQFYPDDFLGSGKVGTMTAEEIGAFVLLLCLDWNENGFKHDEEELARWCRVSRAKFRKIWVRVSRCFDAHDGRMYSPRLQKEREKQAAWREKSAKGGRTKSQANGKGGSTTLEPPLQPLPQPNGNTPVSSLQSPSLERFTAVAETDDPSDPLPKPICDFAYEVWVTELGGVNYGLFRKLLLPVYLSRFAAHPSPDQLAAAIRAFRAAREAEPVQFRSKYDIQRFASALHDWVRVGEQGDRLAVDPVTGLPNEIGIAALGGRR